MLKEDRMHISGSSNTQEAKASALQQAVDRVHHDLHQKEVLERLHDELRKAMFKREVGQPQKERRSAYLHHN